MRRGRPAIAGGSAGDAAISKHEERLKRLRERKRSAGQALDERSGKAATTAKRVERSTESANAEAAARTKQPEQRASAADNMSSGKGAKAPEQEAQDERLNRLLNAKNRGRNR